MKTLLVSAIGWLCLIHQIKGQNIPTPNITCPMGIAVNSYTGNLFIQRQDILLPGRKFDLQATFSYNTADKNDNSGYGNGWSFNYGIRYLNTTQGILICWNDGRQDEFIKNPSNNSYNTPNGVFDNLVNYQAGKFKLITSKKIEYHFEDSTHKRITKMIEPNGNQISFTYTDSLLTTVTDGAGRTLQLAYTNGLLSTITDANGTPRIYRYEYDSKKNLIEYTDPKGEKIRYRYLTNGPLNAVIDKRGNTVSIIYTPTFAVKEVVTCNSRKSISYAAASTTSSSSTYIIDYGENGNNQITTYRFDNNKNLVSKEGNCCGYNVRYEYDQNRNLTKLTDANGREFNYMYDNRGNLLQEIDPLGNIEQFAYEPIYNNMISRRDKNGNTYSFTYDNKGNLVQITKPLGVTESFSYAANGDRTSYTDGRGNTTSFTYGNYGNLIQVNLPLGIQQSYNYDLRGNKVSITNRRGFITSFTYDELNRIVTETDPTGAITTYAYDANGNLISFTDKRGNITNYTYDPLDRVISITDPLNQSKTIMYDNFGNIKRITDQNGNPVTFTYDKLNKITAETNAMGETRQFSYDGNGNRVLINEPNGNTIIFEYDELNRLIKQKDQFGDLITISYDANGNQITQKDGNNNLFGYTYDALNRNTIITDPLGNISVISYDQTDKPTSQTDKNGNTTYWTRDALGRLIKIKDADNFETSYTFDAENNIVSQVDANGRTTVFTYDSRNLKTVETYPDGTATTFSYDANGNKISRSDPNGQLTEYTYDPLNRLSLKNFPGPNDYSYVYDGKGRLMSAINADAQIYYSYDAADRLTAEVMNGRQTSYQYDVINRTKMLTYPSGRVISKRYDTRNRLTGIFENNAPITSLQYDNGNRQTSLAFSNGLNIAMGFDAGNRRVSLNSNPGSILSFAYTHNNNGHVSLKNNLLEPSQSERYSYNNRSELIHVVSGVITGGNITNPISSQVYSYDGLGNRTSASSGNNTISYSINSMNTYQNVSNITPSTLTYDNNANLLQLGPLQLSYDADNKITFADGGQTAAYRYDALGRRISKVSTAGTINYFYDGLNIIEEYDSLNVLTMGYIHGDELDVIYQAKTASDVYYYLYDGAGSVSVITDGSGVVKERYQYDAFGNFTIRNQLGSQLSASTTGNRFFFTGREYDSETGLYYYRNRYYSSSLGRFLQKDPLGILTGPNPFQYTSNNPINFSDPLGLVSFEPSFQRLKDRINSNESKFNAYLRDKFGKVSSDSPMCIDELEILKDRARETNPFFDQLSKPDQADIINEMINNMPNSYPLNEIGEKCNYKFRPFIPRTRPTTMGRRG